MAQQIAETTVVTVLIGMFLIPVILTTIIAVATAWHVRRLLRSVIGASPPSR